MTVTQFKNHKKKGELTVFFALILSIVLLYINVFTEGIRGLVIRGEIAMAMDTALRSSFSEYNQELYKKYEVALLDTSYNSH